MPFELELSRQFEIINNLTRVSGTPHSSRKNGIFAMQPAPLRLFATVDMDQSIQDVKLLF